MHLLVKPYGFQQEAGNFHVPARYSINGYKMGLGKTLIAIDLAVRVAAPRTLIVCPAFLVLNFRREIARFCSSPNRFDVVSYGQLAKVKEDFGQYSCVVFDEAHYLKEFSAKRTQLAHELVAKHRPDYLLLMTGTAIKKHVPDLYSLLKLCWYGGNYKQFDIYSGSLFKFQMDFTVKKTLHLGSRKITKFEGMKNVDRLKALIKPVYIRRTPEEVMELPERVHISRHMADAGEHDSALERAWESYNGGGDRTSFAAVKAVNALAKVEHTLELIKEILDSTTGVLVYSDHVQAVTKIYESLPVGTAKFITGSTSMEARDKYVDDLNHGRIQVLVSTIGALKEGVNITGVNYQIFNDFPWVDADLEQVRKRIHRIGQTKTCFYYYLFSSKVDEYIFRALETKKKLAEEVGT